MKYYEIPGRARTGDQLATSSNTFIRMMSGESYSHVATLYWDDQAPGVRRCLLVFETAGLKGGFRIVPFAQWINEHAKKEISYGVAPDIVSAHAREVGERMRRYRDEGKHLYGWTSLPLVLLSQVTGKKYGQWHRVCSTLSQYFWNASGWKLGHLADPGDIMRSCRMTLPVEV